MDRHTEAENLTYGVSASAWEPLRRPVYRALWIATLASMIGTWMQDVGAAWLMTGLAPSPIMVALVQAATSTPIFLLALPAGALADVVDRRRLLLVAQSWMMVAAAVLATVTLINAVTPLALLMLTFMLGIGAALTAPAWQAIVPEVVTKQEIPAAVSLNGVAINAARAVGPAVGGLLIAAGGPGLAFLTNAVSFVGVVMVLYWWKRPPSESMLPAERFLGALRVGVRYLRHAPALQAVLVRAGLFVFCASALWALIPLLARERLLVGPTGYGMLLGCMGLGAVAAAGVLPRLRARMTVDRMVALASVVFGLALAALAGLERFFIICFAMLMAGGAWLTALATFNVAVQTIVPWWVRARALSTYLLVLFGSMALGSLVWGGIASRWGIPAALVCAAVGFVAGLFGMTRYRLRSGEGFDLAPSRHTPASNVVVEPEFDHGPILTMVEYRIDPEDAEEFSRIMRMLGRVRRRDGALQWGFFSDMSDPDRYVEFFISESWLEHLRFHERITVEDRKVRDRAVSFHRGEEPPVVRHLVAGGSLGKPEKSAN
jgi:MFS family permease